MSSTNTAAAGPVAALAKGLRDLRDNAEGPHGVELEILTSLPADTVAEALRGSELPTLAVTVALVDAWGGDVEAWALYWTQINEIATQAQAQAPTIAPETIDPERRAPAGGSKPERVEATVPVAVIPQRAPEPAVEPEAEAESESEAKTEVDTRTVAAAAATAATESGAAEQGGIADKPEAAKKPNGAKKPGGPSKPKRPDAAEKSRRTPLIIIGLVVLAAGTGGVFAYTAVRGDDKAHKPSAAGAASSTSSPSASASASSKPSPSGTSSAPSPSESSAASAPAAATDTATSYPAGFLIGSFPNVQLPAGYSLDFAHDPSHPTPGTSGGGETLGLQATAAPGADATPTDPFGSAATGTVYGVFLTGQAVVFDADEPGAFERCLNDTRYQSNVDLTQVSVGSQFCIHTPSGRLVLVRVDRMPQSSDANPYAVVDVTEWQG